MGDGLWVEKVLDKLQYLLFFLLIVLLPVQLGRHFWPDFTHVWGLPIDYLAPTIYLTDILVIGLLLSWGISKLKTQNAKRKTTTQSSKLVYLLFCFLIFNVFLARSRGVAFYILLKLVEFYLLVLLLAF